MLTPRSVIWLAILSLLLALPIGFYPATNAAIVKPPVSSAVTAAFAVSDPVAPEGNALGRAARHPHHKHREQNDRKRGHEPRRERAERGPTKRQRAQQWQAMCDGPGMIRLPLSQECTHGPDPIPPGEDVGRPSARVSRAALRSAAMECDGDGRSGPRVQVLYVHASDVSSRFDEYRDAFRVWAADADDIMQESAAAAGGSRRFRFVTTDPCAIDIQEVALSPAVDDGDRNASFDAMVAELKQRGFDRGDRKYLIFFEAPRPPGICGLGTWWDDDSPGQTNWNNYGPSYTQVFADCWDSPRTPAHELMHTLGGVQLSAPNSSGGGHCIDDYDVMCAAEGPRPVQVRCPDTTRRLRFDCNYDDYFDPTPGGDYFPSHWNTADNRFLVGGGTGRDDDGTLPVVTWVTPVSNRATHTATSGTVSLEIQAADATGINRVEFWRRLAGSDTFNRIAADRTAPYTASIEVADLDFGRNVISAQASDGAMNWGFDYIVIERREANPVLPTLSWVAPVGNSETFRATAGTVPLEVTATDDVGIDRIEFWQTPPGGGNSTKIDTDRTAPYTTSLDADTLPVGRTTITALAFDTAQNERQRQIVLERPEPPPAVTIVSPGKGTKLKAGSTVTLTARLGEPAAAAAVEFRVCAGTSCRWDSATRVGTDASTPYTARWKAAKPGAYTFLAQVLDGGNAELSDPVSVTVKKATKKRR